MSTFVVIGLTTGAIYALFALGLVLMYQVTRILNVAFGAIGMVVAFAFGSLHEHLVPGAALAVALACAALAGALLGAVALRLQPAPVAVKAAAAIALVPVLQAVAVLGWGNEPRPSPGLSDGVAFHTAGVAVTTQQVLTIAIAVVAAGGLVVVFRTGLLGSAMRAMAANVDVSRLVGLPVRRLWIVAWTACVVAAGLAAILTVPTTGLSQTSLTLIVLAPLVAALAAGFRAPALAAAVAVALGVADGILQYRSGWATYRPLVPLAVAIVALLTSPPARARARERL